MTARHIIVPLAIALAAFGTAQVLPGYGMFVVLAGSFMWIASEQR